MEKREYKSEEFEFRRQKLLELLDISELQQVDLAKIARINKDTISCCVRGNLKLSNKSIAKIVKSLTSKDLPERIKELDLDINTVQLTATIDKLKLAEEYFIKPASFKKPLPDPPIQQQDHCEEKIEENLILLSKDSHDKIHKFYVQKTHQQSYDHTLGELKLKK
ncbi:hypothetical protein [Desulforhopalus singaporensis]|uniref:Uncharacterized protein n=1 Tax=Desulforhopalus singaporensis TaxID=91360 RepID=A0A1H0W8T0_9BACT|nr:hypothetical protein [Desulforhopalus singaporensis]SDP86871.1 hypothetical protein SAMN05660330_04456 [Desulforhopalus singaporensis]